MLSFKQTLKNDTSKAGQFAARKQTFGEYSRYAVAPMHTRFDAVQWFVWDAFRMGNDGHPDIIRQEDTLEGAVAGLI